MLPLLLPPAQVAAPAPVDALLQRLLRERPAPKAQRLAWEERGLRSGDGETRTRILRLALDAALADGDANRFGALKARFPGEEPDRMLAIQRLLPLIGTGGPRLRVWRLPELGVERLTLGELGRRRIRIGPLDSSGLAALPRDTVAVLPVPEAPGPGGAPLDWVTREAGDRLATAFRAAEREGWMAVSRTEFAEHGFSVFPLIVQLGLEGRVARIEILEPTAAER